MKAIQLMPGVQAGMEGSAGLYVRGGGPDQNLILLDGVPVYNVDHLLGFFSVFTPEAVKKVTLFKSSFPARLADASLPYRCAHQRWRHEELSRSGQRGASDQQNQFRGTDHKRTGLRSTFPPAVRTSTCWPNPSCPKTRNTVITFLMSMPRSTISSLIAAACSSVHTMAKTIL